MGGYFKIIAPPRLKAEKKKLDILKKQQLTDGPFKVVPHDHLSWMKNFVNSLWLGHAKFLNQQTDGVNLFGC